MMSEYTCCKSSSYLILKRISDIVSAIMMLILLFPIFVIVTIAIKLESRGPVFYSVVRLSKNGKPFRYFKYRTMKFDAPEVAIGRSLKIGSDPRITRVGRFLRLTAIDEVPALLNVLKGDMSLVGPRAALPLEIERYDDRAKRRFEVRAGLTGYWQVFGREKNLFSFDKMIDMDLEYIQKCSLMLDLHILFRTIAIGLTKRAAY
jgi:lipopolysaccharide/colanic/teichoic acid biosynthesis glycosyltransferase